MRWTAPHRHPNIRNTIDRYHLYDRTLTMLRTKMSGAGSPCTLWRNSAISFYGTLNTNITKCYCWHKTEDLDTSTIVEKSSPDKDHFLCMGTGALESYQKYGYTEIVFSTPSTATFSSTNIGIGNDANGEPDRFIMSGGGTQEYIDSENYTLTNFKEIDYFLAKESVDLDNNRIEYYYSVNNGSTWAKLTMSAYTTNALGNKQATGFTLEEGLNQIKFRVIFKRRNATAPSPKFNSFRFRYRYHPKLNELDPRFDIDIPAFLASREPPRLEINQSEYGWKTTQPMRWWALPEANIRNTDIIMFLQGELVNRKYEIENLTESAHGPELQILHRSFESSLLRDKYDIIRILDLLI